MFLFLFDANHGAANMRMIRAQILHPHFSQCIGVDLAESMLAKYRKTAAELGLSEQQMKAVRGNLLNPVPDPTEPPTTREELSDFDLVVICMALHHVDDLELAIKCLAEKLRPGGVILVIDWAKMNAAPASVAGEFTNSSSRGNQQDQNPHPGAHTMSHESFTKDQIVGLFQQAGCNQSRFLLADKLTDVPPAPSGKMQMFFAHAKEIQTVSDVATISV